MTTDTDLNKRGPQVVGDHTFCIWVVYVQTFKPSQEHVVLIVGDI